jgi:hypothetical protein
MVDEFAQARRQASHETESHATAAVMVKRIHGGEQEHLLSCV